MTVLDTSIATAGRRHGLDTARTAEDPWNELPAFLRGTVRDCDSHLILAPAETFAILGPELGEPMRRKRQQQYDNLDGVGSLVKDGASIWSTKGTMVPGARDPRQRLEVLDEMGVAQQILFGSGMASIFWSSGDLAYPAANRFNEFAADWAAVDPDRLRPAAIVCCQDPARAVAAAERAISLGLRAVQLAFYPDMSPAASDEGWEPLWSLLDRSRVPALLHWDMRWSLIEAAGQVTKVHVRSGETLTESNRGVADSDLKRKLGIDAEAELDDFAIITSHRTPETFLTQLALAGVFARHPSLRLGVFECTSFWVGPWLERLDALELSLQGLAPEGRRLSDLARRALRITPLYGEPFGRQAHLHRLQEMFVFASDFPHPEGGVRPLQEVACETGTEAGFLEAVLHDNAEAIFPSF